MTFIDSHSIQGFASEDCQNLEFESYWENVPIGRKISDGVRLREEKLKCREIKPRNVCKLAKLFSRDEIDLGQSSVCFGFTEIAEQAPNNYKCSSPQRKSRKYCSMRIAELAVPTKRRCIETWRENCCTLPDVALERLKQYVLDERPVVPIPDAVYYFKRPHGVKRSNKKSNKFKKGRLDSKTKSLCTLFGHRITKILNKPMNIDLDARSQKICAVVAEDIKKMLKYGKKDNRNNDKIHNEISKKITLWILNILEESSNKLLEEDLRDLEEQEGPVLDIIDDLIEGVLDICCPVVTLENDPVTTSSLTTDIGDFQGNKSLSLQTLYSNTENNKPMEIELKDKNLEPEKVPSGGVEYLDTTDEIDDITNELRFEISNIIDNIAVDIVNSRILENDNPEDSNGNDDIISTADELQEPNDLDEIKTKPVTEETDSNESHSLSLQLNDDKYKKVKFSNMLINQNIINDDKDPSRQPDWNSYYIKPSVSLSAPNYNLLSIADEVWPDDKSSFAIKPSASVNKSITSLGKLLETDEQLISSLDSERESTQYYEVDNTETDIFEVSYSQNDSHDFNITGAIKPHQVNDYNNEIKEQQNDHSMDITKEIYIGDTEKPIKYDVKVSLDPVNQKNVHNTAEVDKHQEIVDKTKSNKNNERLTDGSKAEREMLIDIIMKSATGAVKTKSRIPELKNFIDHQIMDLKSQSISPHIKCLDDSTNFIGESDIRRWCKDLDQGYKNLELWNQWILNVCGHIAHLNNNQVLRFADPTTKHAYQKSWMTLKKHVDKDTQVWLQLNKRAQCKSKHFITKLRKQLSNNYRSRCYCFKHKYKPLTQSLHPYLVNLPTCANVISNVH